MKDLKILFICISLTFLLYSCTDNPYNPIVDPQPVVLFQADSVYISSSDSGRVNLSSSQGYLITDTSVRNINFQFRVQSNTSDSADQIFYEINLGKSGVVSIFSIKEYPKSNIDTSYNFTYDISAYNDLGASFTSGIFYKVNYNFKYMTIKNIKITKLN
jgi:hypothetical protein